MMDLMVRDKVTMTSNEIAKLTGKEHKHVMRDIRKIVEIIGIEEGGPNVDSENETQDFKKGTYLNTRNQVMANYTLTKKGTMLLLTGYSIKLRFAVLNRFEEMENELAKPKPMTQIEQARLYLETLLEKEALEKKGNLMMLQREDSSFVHIKTALKDNRELKEELDDVFEELNWKESYSTILYIERQYKIKCDWRKLKSKSQELGFEIRKVPDKRYGEVNSYHNEVFGIVYNLDL